MKYTKRFTAAAMAGLIGAMTLVSGVTAYAATGWQQNGSTYYYYDANGELHKGWLNTENGYYYLPNVDVAEEEMDAMAATRSYEANLAVLNAVKSMAQTALSIGNN